MRFPWPRIVVGDWGAFADAVNNRMVQLLTRTRQPDPTVVLTYGVTIALDAELSHCYRITATNGVAFTISNPTNAMDGGWFVLDIKNSSGGALGAITFGAAFLLAGAFVNPANTKRRTIMFYFDATNWVEVARAAADI